MYSLPLYQKTAYNQNKYEIYTKIQYLITIRIARRYIKLIDISDNVWKNFHGTCMGYIAVSVYRNVLADITEKITT